MACENDHENIVKYLVEHDQKYDYILTMARRHGNENIIKYLEKYGADV